jgi:peptidyl-tRNA hydrolase
MKHKMYCIFAQESVKKMSGIRGKMCTQAGHAYVHTMLRAIQQYPQHVTDYLGSGHAYKITLIVDTVDELRALQEAYKDKCSTHLVTDAGFTVFTEPTTTCLGIGPLSEELIGDDLKALKTFT